VCFLFAVWLYNVLYLYSFQGETEVSTTFQIDTICKEKPAGKDSRAGFYVA
jgi:hypothetical protein